LQIGKGAGSRGELVFTGRKTRPPVARPIPMQGCPDAGLRPTPGTGRPPSAGGRHEWHEICSVSPSLAVADLIRQLSARRIGAVLVQGPAGQLLGIVSERDIVHAFAREGAAALDLSAGDLMTRTVRTATLATTEQQAMELMTEGRFRHLPVLDDSGALAGIISIGDVVKARISQQEHEVDSLRAYVSGAA